MSKEEKGFHFVYKTDEDIERENKETAEGLTEDKILKKLNKKNPIKQLWEFLLFVEQKRMEAQEKSMIGKI